MITIIRLYLFIFLATVLTSTSSLYAKELNGFGLDNALIPATQIFSGGPDKDGIPSIDNPKFISVREASFIADSDRVLGITINGVSKAYPIEILNWHEIVNDAIGDVPYAITYCPLCGTGMAFDSRINQQVLSFGVSGLLYDRESKSLWSQLLSKAVTGQLKGTELKTLPVQHTTWLDWKRHHPSSRVLSKNTGYWRAYARDPYAGYEKSEHLYFPVFNAAPKLYHPKERVIGLTVKGKFKAYPFVELNKNNEHVFEDTVDGQLFSVHWNSEQQSGYILDSDGSMVPIVQSYWFAWYAFHPKTDIFKSE